jgi:acetylxylan esterase
VIEKARFAPMATAMLLLASSGFLSRAHAATVEQITSFGSNPSGIDMYLYTPSNVAAKPAILVGPHACHGKATDVCQGGNAFAQQADKHGYLLVCPGAKSSDGCWDVHSKAVLTHDGGGDAGGMISMVRWVVDNRNGDPERVFAAGHSSGGMMTNVLLGSYPDVFKAGAAFAGVPFACYAQGAVDSLGWNTTCATGKVVLTGPEWGDLVRAAYPVFSGPRPRMQLWHGTNDDVLYFQNFKEEIKQWTNVLGLRETPTSTENNALQSTWIRTRYADDNGVIWLEAIQETGQPHNLIVDAAEAIHFFGLDNVNSQPDAGTKDGAGRDAMAGTGGAGGDTGGRGGTGGNSGSGGLAGSSAGARDAGSGGAGGSTSAAETGGRGSGGSATGGDTTSANTGGSGIAGRTSGTGGSNGGSGSATRSGGETAGGSGGGAGAAQPGSGGSGGARTVTGGAGGVSGAVAASGTSGVGGAAQPSSGGSGGARSAGGGATGRSGPVAESRGCSCSMGTGRRIVASPWWALLLWLCLGRRKLSGQRACDWPPPPARQQAPTSRSWPPRPSRRGRTEPTPAGRSS